MDRDGLYLKTRPHQRKNHTKTTPSYNFQVTPLQHRAKLLHLPTHSLPHALTVETPVGHVEPSVTHSSHSTVRTFSRWKVFTVGAKRSNCGPRRQSGAVGGAGWRWATKATRLARVDSGWDAAKLGVVRSGAKKKKKKKKKKCVEVFAAEFSWYFFWWAFGG